MIQVSIVIPVYNEGRAIESNLPRIISVLGDEQDDYRFQVIVVDDGSEDGSTSWLQNFAAQHSNIDLLVLSRNFGKEAAILAGLTHASGDAVVVMDSDLQHPPALIAKMLIQWRQGYDVVEACKSDRGQEGFLSTLMAGGFYRLFKMLSGMDITNNTDFKLLDRRVVDAYCDLPERKRFFRGMIPWIGYSRVRLFFEVPAREHGVSSWSSYQLLKLSLTALTSFTSRPLHFITFLGMATFFFSLVLGSISLYQKFSGLAVSGFTTVILLVLFTGSCIMVGLGLVGVYLEQIFDEVKRRPPFLIDRRKSRARDS